MHRVLLKCWAIKLSLLYISVKLQPIDFLAPTRESPIKVLAITIH